MKQPADILIVGAGPAGMSAAIQAARDGFKPILVSSEEPGGLLRAARRLENVPGFHAGIRGEALAGRIVKHVYKFGIEPQAGKIVSLERAGDNFAFRLSGGESGLARAVILAQGTKPCEPDFSVSRAARPFIHRDPRTMPEDLKGSLVAVIGSGEAALDGALTARDRGATVKVLARGPRIKAPDKLVEEASRSGVRMECSVPVASIARLAGGLSIRHPGGKATAAGLVLVCIGRAPELALWEMVSGGMAPPSAVETAVPGLFCAGDMIRGIDRFAATAIGDGQVAARLAERFLISR